MLSLLSVCAVYGFQSSDLFFCFDFSLGELSGPPTVKSIRDVVFKSDLKAPQTDLLRERGAGRTGEAGTVHQPLCAGLFLQVPFLTRTGVKEGDGIKAANSYMKRKTCTSQYKKFRSTFHGLGLGWERHYQRLTTCQKY